MSSLKHYADFELYSRALIESKDVDPVYPVVKWIVERYDFQPEWFVFVYTAFYNLESAIIMCREMPDTASWDQGRFISMRNNSELRKFGHERRGSCRNIQNQIGLFEDAIHFVDRLPPSEELDNRGFRDGLMACSFQGEWASFKAAELFEKSLDYKTLTIHDLGLEGKDPNRNDGPVGGLRWLYGRDNRYTENIYPTWNRFGAALAEAWGVDMGEVETCLCKWHKVVTGKYWIGHDIAEFFELAHVMGQKDYNAMMGSIFHPALWEGMTEFPKQYKQTYARSGSLINKEFAQRLPRIDVFSILMRTK